MHTGYSPYDMTNEAVRLISKSQSSEQGFSTNERQIILLLNKAETYSHMSKYQLANAHKLLGDIYFDKNITGSALQHYEIALGMNPQLSVKRKMKTLRSLAQGELKYSIDANLAGEPDYTNLTFHKSELTDEFIERRKKQMEESAELWGMTVDELNAFEQRTREQLKADAENEDKIYDPEFEREIEERLSRLDDLSRSEFYRIRSQHNPSDILSAKELDMLTLSAMEKSFSIDKKIKK